MDTTLTISAYRTFDTASLAKLSLNLKGRPVVKIGRTSYEMRLTGKPNLTLPQWKMVAEDLDRILVGKNILDGTDTNKDQLDGLRVHNEGVVFRGATHYHAEGTNTTALWTQITDLARTAPAAGAAGGGGAAAGAPPPPAPLGAAVPAAQANARLLARQALRHLRYQEGERLAQWSTLINDLVSDDRADELARRLGEGSGMDAGQAKEYLREETVEVARTYLTQTIDSIIRRREGWQRVRGNEELTNDLRNNIVEAITLAFGPHMNDGPAVEGGEVLIADAEAKRRIRERVLNAENISTCVQTRLQTLLDEEAARPATPVIGPFLQDCRAQAEQLWQYGQTGYGWFNQARDYLGY